MWCKLTFISLFNDLLIYWNIFFQKILMNRKQFNQCLINYFNIFNCFIYLNFKKKKCKQPCFNKIVKVQQFHLRQLAWKSEHNSCEGQSSTWHSCLEVHWSSDTSHVKGLRVSYKNKLVLAFKYADLNTWLTTTNKIPKSIQRKRKKEREWNYIIICSWHL